MNNQSTALLEILSRCNPKDMELKKESYLQTIIHSEDYIELSARKAFRPYFDQLLSIEKLKTYSERELSAIRKAIPLIPTALEDIIFSIKNGAAPDLTSADKPDFLNSDSLRKLINKLHDSTGKNYTNIDSDDFMTIFDGETVKTIGNKFDQLPADCTEYTTGLAEIMQGKKYCISDAEMHAHEVEYRSKIADLNEQIFRTKKKRKTRRFIKAEVGLIAIFVPTLVSGITGGISSGVLGGCTVAEILLAIAFMIWG